MATEIIMPKAGMAMERGTIISWLKKPGDPVEAGEPLLEIETDKVSMEVEAERSGYLLSVIHQEGEEVEVITTIGYIGDRDEVLDPAPSEPSPALVRTLATPAARRIAREANVDLATVTPTGKWGEIRRKDVEQVRSRTAGSARVSPLARQAADRHGVDPGTLSGSGPGGRVLSRDVLGAAAATTGEPGRPLTPMRRRIAQRMLESHRSVPAVTLNSKVDVTMLAALRDSLNSDDSGGSDGRLSMTPFFVRAVALALRTCPWMCMTWAGEKLVEHSRLDIGIAVALEDGLIVPVLRAADTRSIHEISREIRELASRARAGKLELQELHGAMFSITNLGMYGISSFNPIINPPETAILGINATEDELYLDAGSVRSRTVTTLSLTLDHRVIDGAQGAIFLQKISELLRNPARLLV